MPLKAAARYISTSVSGHDAVKLLASEFTRIHDGITLPAQMGRLESTLKLTARLG
jgi:hypothetical protein